MQIVGWSLEWVEDEDGNPIPALLRSDGAWISLDTVSAILDLSISRPEVAEVLLDLLEVLISEFSYHVGKA